MHALALANPDAEARCWTGTTTTATRKQVRLLPLLEPAEALFADV